jgi:transcriptional regulator NrdR family protein
MNCPSCDTPKTDVLETRKYKDYPGWNYRLRKCIACNYRFKTLEMTIEDFQNALTTPTEERDDIVRHCP